MNLNRIKIIESILRKAGNQIDGQYQFKNLIMKELSCAEATARRAIKEAVSFEQVVPVSGLERKLYYILFEKEK